MKALKVRGMMKRMADLRVFGAEIAVRKYGRCSRAPADLSFTTDYTLRLYLSYVNNNYCLCT